MCQKATSQLADGVSLTLPKPVTYPAQNWPSKACFAGEQYAGLVLSRRRAYRLLIGAMMLLARLTRSWKATDVVSSWRTNPRPVSRPRDGQAGADTVRWNLHRRCCAGRGRLSLGYLAGMGAKGLFDLGPSVGRRTLCIRQRRYGCDATDQ